MKRIIVFIIYNSIIFSVFDKPIWCTIGPKSFLFGTAQLSLWASGTVNYDYIVTNSISSFPKAHTLTIVEPIWSMLQNLSKILIIVQFLLHLEG